MAIVRELGALIDPQAYRDPPDISGEAPDRLVTDLRTMVTIRRVEECIARLMESGEVNCPCHLAIGQEAPPVGVARHTDAKDWVFGHHRSHGHFLAHGGGVYELLAEVLGRVEGCSRGHGGSMHLYAPEAGFHGSVPIVGATVPIAVGAALAARKRGDGSMAVSYLGDSALEEGAVNEALNLASVMKLPILFVCENNLFASHMDIDLRQPSDRVARFAEGARMPHASVDGNDVVAVSRAVEGMIGDIRAGKAPGFVEAVTYRWRGHVGPDENIDVGLRRSAETIASWKERDPVRRLRVALEAAGHLAVGAFEDMDREIEAAVAGDLDRARAAPLPDPAQLLDTVYAGRSRGRV